MACGPAATDTIIDTSGNVPQFRLVTNNSGFRHLDMRTVRRYCQTV